VSRLSFEVPPFGKEFYETCTLYMKEFMDRMKGRIAAEARLRKHVELQMGLKGSWSKVRKLFWQIVEREKLYDEPWVKMVHVIDTTYRMEYAREERMLIAKFKSLTREHPIWRMIGRVRGFADRAAIYLLGGCDPYKFRRAGGLRAYWNLVPYTKKRAKVKTVGNPRLKGKGLFLASVTVMRRDPFYYPLYRAKKHYYENTERVREMPDGRFVRWAPFKEIYENPKLCPIFKECEEQRKKRAKRLGTEVKPPACRRHCDDMARYWLASRIISHAYSSEWGERILTGS